MTLNVRRAPYRLPASVERAVAVEISGTVYIAGGLDASGTTASGVFALDPGTGKLTHAGDLPQPVHDAAGALIGGKLFVFGGGSSVGTDLVQTFDPATGGATVTGHLPVALSDLAATTVGATTYLVGGYDGSQPRREIYATTDGRAFRTVARLPVGLRYPAVTAVGNTIVVAGGEKAGGLSDAVYAFDTTGGRVRTIAHLSAPLGYAAAFTLGGLAYVAGGRNAGGAAVASIVSIDPASGTLRRRLGFRGPWRTRPWRPDPRRSSSSAGGPGPRSMRSSWQTCARVRASRSRPRPSRPPPPRPPSGRSRDCSWSPTAATTGCW